MKAYYENRIYGTDLPVTAGSSNNMSFLAHWHTDVELVLVRDGKITVGVNKESRVLCKGEMAVCSSGDIHYYDSSGGKSKTTLVIFRPDVIGCPGGWPFGMSFKSPFYTNGAGDSPDMPGNVKTEVEKAFDELEDELSSHREHSGLFIKSRLYYLCGAISRYFPAIQDSSRAKPLYDKLKAMQDVLDYIGSNYAGDMTLEDAARQASLSVFHFSRVFKETTGMNFKAYLNHTRVRHAEALISGSGKPIIDVAFECGFNSIRTFNRVFMAVKGCQPSELRSGLRAADRG